MMSERKAIQPTQESALVKAVVGLNLMHLRNQQGAPVNGEAVREGLKALADMPQEDLDMFLKLQKGEV